jgi:hypothetical protein
MKLSMLKENKKMNKINNRFRILICFAVSLLGSDSVFGQANPGYMGKKSLVQFDLNGLMGNVIFSGPSLKMNWGVSYEVATKKGFAWNLGYKSVNQEMSKDLIGGEYISLAENDNRGLLHDVNGGYFNYHVDEFRITPRFYSESKGAIAPYGSYSGLDLAFDVLTVSNQNQVTFDGGALTDPTIPTSIAPVYLFAVSYVQGGRRMLTENIGIDFNFGMGYTLYQTTPSNLAILIDDSGTYFYDKEEFFQTIAMKHFSSSRLFHASVGVSYLF